MLAELDGKIMAKLFRAMPKKSKSANPTNIVILLTS